jgi:hypothetical protein
MYADLVSVTVENLGNWPRHSSVHYSTLLTTLVDTYKFFM